MNGRGAYLFAIVILCGLCSVTSASARHPVRGLRWVGEARVATNVNNAVLVGPYFYFRYGSELYKRPKGKTTYARVHGQIVNPSPRPEAWYEWTFGRWAGLEASAGQLTGILESGRVDTMFAFGIRPWLSRSQYWFLDTRRFSILGALLPGAGVAVSSLGQSNFNLFWDWPIGTDHYQIVPGFIWMPNNEQQPWLGSVAFRVAM